MMEKVNKKCEAKYINGKIQFMTYDLESYAEIERQNRFYRWATAQFDDQSSQDFPLAKNLPSMTLGLQLEFFRSLPSHLRGVAVHTLLARKHAYAVERLKETPSTKDIEFWQTEWRNFLEQNKREYELQWLAHRPAASPSVLKRFRKAMLRNLSDALGIDGKKDNGALVFRSFVHGWIIDTRVYIDKPSGEIRLYYSHLIGEYEGQREAYDVRKSHRTTTMLSCLGFFEEYKILTEDDEEKALFGVPRLIRHFLEGMDTVLNGVSPARTDKAG